MNIRTLRSLVLLTVVLAVVGGCSKMRERAAGDAATETIAPAAPQPQPTGTDAMTQTVDIEDSRSEAEGAALTDPDHPQSTTGTTGTTATAATATAPPPGATATR